ncbi:DsbC family protein [Glaciecola sp. MH2013]|uniref:DsbC family protein n=1 Tax=Glaciecola sp. MH2013 TaxID=2785524 RepID=UPI0018A1176A|nr:DsbC family protein [Glaciecola sp. MH2013]MBF7072868.1 DsbC family protein [Glaciecola sp. MH2013]
MLKKSLVIFVTLVLALSNANANENELNVVENNLRAANPVFANANVVVHRELSSMNMEGLYEASIDGQSLVVTKDGKRAVIGEVFDLQNMVNLTRVEKQKGQVILAQQEIAKLNEDDFVTYPAEGESIGQLYVFSDTTCGYCRKLHLEVADYQKAGIDVKYIPYPRSQLIDGEVAFEKLKQVMCADDKQTAMTKIKEGSDNNAFVKTSYEQSCIDSIRKGQLAGRNVGLQGTPFMYLSDASTQIIPGYQESSMVISLFNKAK